VRLSGRAKPSPTTWSRSYTYFLTGRLGGQKRPLEERKIFSSKRLLNYNCSHFNVYRSCYTDWATRNVTY
jgi:hypothetical protein